MGKKLKKKIVVQKLKTKYTWKDIVLPPHQLIQLKELCNQIKYHKSKFNDWGFNRRPSIVKGVKSLFSGPPGTGKTLAGKIIANELGLEIYRIDLSQVVSKYIGETEKNLEKIFRKAEDKNWILFFDEADALFGKRSEVKDSHDRYANIEISYLFERIEDYIGLVILAINMKSSLDRAFLRRIHFIVEFPFPSIAYRKQIWKVLFSKKEIIGKNSLSDDVNFSKLARDIKLPGGKIKNIALMAVLYATKEKENIQMKHVVKATRREYQKTGR